MKNIKDMTITALMTALICVLGPFSLPIGPVPIALTNFVIFITLYVIGMKRGLIAVALYLLIGLIGLPVFSGFGAGIGKLVGPTGGYLIGYLPMALMAGAAIDIFWKNRPISIAAMTLSTVVLYIIGTAWLAHTQGITFMAALMVGVVPFAAEDFLKIVLCAAIGPVLKERVDSITSQPSLT